MSEINKIEKVKDDVYNYEKTITLEKQVSVKHLLEEKLRLQKRIEEIDNILNEIAKIK